MCIAAYQNKEIMYHLDGVVKKSTTPTPARVGGYIDKIISSEAENIQFTLVCSYYRNNKKHQVSLQASIGYRVDASVSSQLFPGTWVGVSGDITTKRGIHSIEIDIVVEIKNKKGEKKI